jgi:hypothetical protein
MDAIEKQGHFKAHKKAHEAYVEQHNPAKQVKAALAELDRTTSEGEGASRSLPRSIRKEAAATADASKSGLQAIYQLDLMKSREAAENARAKVESAAQDMFQFYTNLLSVDAKYAWNKIVQEQTQSNPYMDLQGVSKKGPRGLTRKAFDDCVMFHLFTVFLNNAYYFMIVLKKPQRISVHQFVQHVEQLNSYMAQLPCWFYSPSAKPTTILVNVSFTEADLASHALRPTYVTGPLQLSQERYDFCGHVFASYVFQGYRARIYTGKVQCTILQEMEGQERKQVTWY